MPDPNKPTISLNDLPGFGSDMSPTTKVVNGVTYQWNGKEWVTAPGLPQAQTNSQIQPIFKEIGGILYQGTPNQFDPTIINWQKVNVPQGSQTKMEEEQDPLTGAIYSVDPYTRERVNQLSPAISGWVAGRGVPTPPSAPQRAPRYPDEEELAQLNVQKARQDLMDPYSLASQQRAEVLKTLTDQMSQGLIDETQANQTLKLWDDKTNAALQGTTPWAQETNRRTLAANNINDMYQAGTSLAPNLLSAALNMYKGILPNTGAPYGFNPLTETQNWQKGLNPAPELTDLSRGLLSGALGGQ